MALQNNCTPQKYYGPYKQTLFLGLSVRDFSVSAGLNEQYTTLTVNLVEDTCSGIRDYIDSNFIWQTGISFANGDPGLNNAPVGSPAIFKIAETFTPSEDPMNRVIDNPGFEFAGIIQSYTRNTSPEGSGLVQVNLVSPNVILGGTQFILDKTADQIPEISGALDTADDKLPNIFNVYGFLESLNGNCLDFADPFTGAGVGSPAGGFGNSQRTDRGIPWVWIKKAMQVLVGGKYSAGNKKFALEPGTIRYPSGVGTYGSIQSTHYILDISELPGDRQQNIDNVFGGTAEDFSSESSLSSLQYKLAGPVMTASDIISQVAQDAGVDYYVELLPSFSYEDYDQQKSIYPIINIIKIKTIPRNNYEDANTLSGIQKFIDNNTNSGYVLNYNIGQEFVNENTNAVLVGGNRQDMYQLFATGLENAQQGAYGHIQPFFGYQPPNPEGSRFVSGTFVKEPIPVFWGQDPPNYSPEARQDNQQNDNVSNSYLQQWFFDLDYSRLPTNFKYSADVGYWKGDPESLLCAALGDFESWLRWFVTFGGGPYLPKECKPDRSQYYKATKLWNQIQDVLQNEAPGTAFFDPLELPFYTDGNFAHPQDEVRMEYNNISGLKDGKTPSDPQSLIFQDLKTIYEYLNDVAEEYYGKAFNVEIPYICRSTNNETQTVIYSDVPAVDGGYVDVCKPLPEDTAPPDNPADDPNSDPANGGSDNANSGCSPGTFRNIMGLDHRNETDIFADDQGKLPAILKFDPFIGYGVYHDRFQDYLNTGLNSGKDRNDLLQSKGAPNFIRNTHIGFNNDFYTKGGGWTSNLAFDPFQPVYARAEIDPDWMIINKPIYATGGPGDSGINDRSVYSNAYASGSGITYNALLTLTDRLLLAPNVRKNFSQEPGLPLYIPDGPYFGVAETSAGRFLGSNWRLATHYDRNTRTNPCYLSKHNIETWNSGDPDGNYKPAITGETLGEYLDKAQFTAYGNLPFALPCNALIPIKSNVRTYGPFSKFSKKTTTIPPADEFGSATEQTDIILGRTYTAQDDGLVPWEYGGSEFLQQAASATLEQIVMPQQQIERGSVTVAGYPALQLGYNINEKVNHLTNDQGGLFRYPTIGGYDSPQGTKGFYYLNTTPLTTGSAQVTNININVSPGGITTSYQLSAFTNVYGRFAKNNAERIKTQGQEKYSRERAIRADKRKSQNLKLIARNNTENNKYSFKPVSSAQSTRSPGIVMVGKYHQSNDYPSGFVTVPDGGTTPINNPTVNKVARKEVATYTQTELKSIGQSYDNMSIMSMDGFFRPVQKRSAAITASGLGQRIPIENDAPNIVEQNTIYRSGPYDKQVRQSESPPGPLNQYTGLVINTDYLNFLANPNSDLASRSKDLPTVSGFVPIGSGHDIEIVARSSNNAMSRQNNMRLGTIGTNQTINYTDDYRYMAHRGPLVLHGWGYDVYGKPVPNSNETGVFTGIPGQSGLPINEWVSGSPYSGLHRKDYNLLSDEFHPGFLNQPETWPVGPVDLRWDRKRSVWTVPNNFRIYVANLYNGLSGLGDTTTAAVYNADDVYDATGGRPVDWEIEVTMPLPDVSIDAEPVLVYYSHESGQWWPLGFCCGGGSDTPSTCLVGNTLIETPNGQIEIKDLDIGDEVITHQGIGIVEQVMSAMVEETLEIGFTDNTYIRCTTSHPFALQGRTEDLFNEAQYVQAGYLYEGQTLLGPNGENKTIKGTALLKERKKIYNLTVSNDHTYISNGIYSHNKGISDPCPSCPNPACSWECTSGGWVLSTDCVKDNHPSGDCVCYNPCSDAECTRLQNECGCNTGQSNDPRPRCVTAGLCIRDWCDDTRPGDCPNIDCGGGGPIV